MAAGPPRLAGRRRRRGVRRDRQAAGVRPRPCCGCAGCRATVPGDLIDVLYEGDRVTLSNADTISRPLRLTADEALALLVALRTLTSAPGLGGGDAVRRALAKIETAVGVEAESADRVAVAVEGEASLSATVGRALETGRRLHLSYYVPGRDEVTERDVDPMRLVLAGGRTYLEGWCRRVEDVRLFRLDRVHDLTVLDVDADVPAQATPRDLAEGLFAPSPDDALVTLQLTAAARWVADYYPCELVDEGADGGAAGRLAHAGHRLGAPVAAAARRARSRRFPTGTRVDGGRRCAGRAGRVRRRLIRFGPFRRATADD